MIVTDSNVLYVLMEYVFLLFRFSGIVTSQRESNVENQ